MSTSVPSRARAQASLPTLRRWGLAGVAAAVAAATLQPTPATASTVEAPVLIAPADPVTALPQLAWEASVGATGYEVQVDDQASFASPEWRSTTVNTITVPTSPMRSGTQHVRVRAKDARNTWSPWSQTSFTVVTAPGPSLVSPANESELTQPDEPPLLAWTPLTGAQSYTVEIDTEPNFIDPLTYTTTSTSMVVPANQNPQETYHWRVRATFASGVFSDFSDARTYQVFALPAPVVVGPSNDEDVTDVVLEWEPVAGAKHYELEVDDDHDFSSPESGIPAAILGTRFSPRTTFGNDQYYWRVRAVDANNNPSPWVRLADEDHYEFDRVWRDTPTLVHPFDSSGTTTHAGDDLYFQWTPVRNASHYQLWLSTDPHFTDPSPVTKKCLVVGTTYTPGESGDGCMPASEGEVYYWKVRAYDKPYDRDGVEGIFSASQRFTYRDPSAFTFLTPAQGATVAIPTVSWKPVDNAASYTISFIDASNRTVHSQTTRSTSYTPPKLDTRNGSSFEFTLKANDAYGRSSVIVRRTFTLGAPEAIEDPYLVPATKPATYDAPSLSWSPHPSTTFDRNGKPLPVQYRIKVRKSDAEVWLNDATAPLLSTKWEFPAASDPSDYFLAEGDYVWRVDAYDSEGTFLGRGPEATFTVRPLEAVTGQRIALSGLALDEGDVCARSLRDGARNWCDSTPTTPVLDWDSVPYASFYRVHVSRDADFTTGLVAPDVSTTNTRWTPRPNYVGGALPDSQASTAYHWFIQPCKTPTKCGPDPRSTVKPADHAFRKTSPRVELLAPTDGATATSTTVTFDWKDYLETNLATTYSETSETSSQEAMSYELQVSTDPQFGSTLEHVTVDQTTYTSATTTYPEGPLHWRVQPVDGAGNKLGWTESRIFTKTSPSPELLSPLAGATVNRTVPFRWKAMPYASAYEIQVAANEDTNFSNANLVVKTRSSKRPAWTNGIAQPGLAPSDNAYVWRVRRIESSGRTGDWSTPERFFVAAEHPTPLTPADAATVGPRALALSWDAVEGTSRHKVHLRRVGTTSVTTTTTAATSWAPTAIVVGATYEWRVEALDSASKVIGDSGWQTYTIGGPPTATVATRITGTGVLGEELTVTAPVWDHPGVRTTFQWMRDGEPIEGATASTYVVSEEDVHHTLTVVATGDSAEFGFGSSTSNEVVGQPGAGPVALGLPTVSGPGRVGTTLVSTPVAWDRAGVVTTLQWMRGTQPISGATGITYTLTPDDVRSSVSLRVTGTLVARRPTVVTSNAVTVTLGDAPRVRTNPVVTGDPRVGRTLTATAPTWDQPGVVDSRQWLRDGTPIAGATAVTYVPTAADLDRTLSVRFSGSKAGHDSATATSAGVTVRVGDAPSVLTRPSLSGTAKVGGTLHVATPTWSLTGVVTAVQWLRDGTPIAGATGFSYTPGAADLGRTVSARVRGTRAGHAEGTAESAGLSIAPGDAPVAQSRPVVEGTPRVGETLRAVAPSWNRSGVQTTHVWLRDGVPIAGHTGSTYVVVASDAGSRISLRYTGTQPGHAEATSTSASVLVLPGAAPVPSGNAAPTGGTAVGATLRAPALTWDRAGVRVTRQWLRDGVPLAGQAGETYVVVEADAGHTISVLTTGTLAGHAPAQVTSAGVVIAAPEPPVVTPPSGPVASKVALTVPKKVRAKGKRKVRVKVKIRVTASGTTPTGMVQVRVGKRLVGKGKLRNGRLTVKLKPLKVGRHTLKVTYRGSSTVKKSMAKKKVRIVRR